MAEFFGPEDSHGLADRAGLPLEAASEEESQAISAQQKAIDSFFAERRVAKYKIEIQFGKGRSTWKHFPGALTIYLSGTKLNGEGDEKVYICPREDCRGVIHPNERLGATVMCRKCKMMWPEKELAGELLYRLTPNDWATVILRYFNEVGHNADIYLKYHRTDVRYQTAMELARAQGGEAINKARTNRGLHIYPLKNLIKDSTGGADIYGRILAFIRA